MHAVCRAQKRVAAVFDNYTNHSVRGMVRPAMSCSCPYVNAWADVGSPAACHLVLRLALWLQNNLDLEEL